jgi:hypothetical protein
MAAPWKEEFLNAEGKRKHGTPETEEVFFNHLATQIRDVVRHYAENHEGIKQRANHARILAGFTRARFTILPSTAETKDLFNGFISEGKSYDTIIRFSNASGATITNDALPDLRGAALRIHTTDGPQDFLMTNAEPHHARDAREAMIAIESGVMKDIIAGRIPDNFPGEETLAGVLGALPYMVRHMGLDGFKMAGTLKRQMKLKVESLATETFWSRAPMAIGPDTTPENAKAVKFRLRPARSKRQQNEITQSASNLEEELMHRLEQDDVGFMFEVQFYQDETTTPIEDSSVSWPTPFFPIASLTIPKGSANEKEEVDALHFSPWNVDARHFRPLGSMNRSRKKVYAASVDERQGH